MKAFQNERQDTFHSLDMYSKPNKNSSNFDKNVTILKLFLCVFYNLSIKF